MVIAQRDFQEKEYDTPKAIFQKAGFEVVTAAEEKGVAKNKMGGETKVDISLNDVNVRDFEAIVFVGGPGAEAYFEHEKVLNLVKEVNQEGRLIAAICIAPTILANAGILNGKNATAFVTEEDSLRRGGANFTAAPVEADGNIITANGPEAAEVFGKKIVELLQQT